MAADCREIHARRSHALWGRSEFKRSFAKLIVKHSTSGNYCLALIKSWVPLVRAELFFNLDGTGLSDWEERRPKPVLIPTTIENADLHYFVDRGIRHQTLLCCVSASRDAYCSLLLCSSPASLSIFHMGIRDGIDFRIKIQSSPYLNKELFLEYVHEVFLPAVESDRELPGCRGKPAILFYDNSSCHCSDEILRELASLLVLLITCAPRSSHVFQVLDVLLFAKLK
jgi:hypothetical protein